MMEVIQSQIQSHGSKLIIDQVIKQSLRESVSDFQSDFLARELHAAILCVCGVFVSMCPCFAGP